MLFLFEKPWGFVNDKGDIIIELNYDNTNSKENYFSITQSNTAIVEEN